LLLIEGPFICLNQPHPAFGGGHLARVGRLARTEVLSLDADESLLKVIRDCNHLMLEPSKRVMKCGVSSDYRVQLMTLFFQILRDNCVGVATLEESSEVISGALL
jgi:hypothetical protein